MSLKAQTPPQTIEGARAELSRRLEARRSEIEAAVMTRVYAVADPSDLDPTYAEGLRAAVTAAVDYGLAAIELGEERSPSPPPILLAQARLAARAGVPLDTVLRRYFAGHALLGDYLIAEATRCSLRRAELQKLLRDQATLFDRLLAAVSEEHVREKEDRVDSSEQRRSERVKGLLAGELLDTSELQYDFEVHHLGAIAVGPGSAEAIRDLAGDLDCRLLALRPEEGMVWAWFGGRRRVDAGNLELSLAQRWPANISLALGEPGKGLIGWRLTHQQARAALPIVLRTAEPYVRYADVALLASTLNNDLLVTSLRRLYLEPLERERDGGGVARETLRAYFAANRNVSSAAAALGVSRRTISNRIKVVEERFGRPIEPTTAELETALRLHALDASPDIPS